MSRTYPGDFADRAYERFCAKRDREAQSKRGSRANGHPLKAKSKTSKLKQQNDDNETDSETQRASRLFFQKHSDLIELRRHGRSLEEIAVATGKTRLGIFRVFQQLPSNKLKLELGVPT